MKNMNRYIDAVITVVLILGTATALSAQNWPQWRGLNRDGKVEGFKAPETWPDKLKQEWNVKVGFGDATPALVDNKLYVFTRIDADEVIKCLDAKTGKEIWQNSYAAQV